jgi:uncharacterized membrane protein
MNTTNILNSAVQSFYVAPEKRNVGSGERLFSLSSGTVLTLLGLGKLGRGGLLRLLPGAYLLWRGASGYCPVYDAFHVDTTEGADAFSFSRSFNVLRNRKELYTYWRNLDNLPKIMQHIKQVKKISANKYSWKAQFNGQEIHWHAQIIDDVPDERIGWSSVDNADVRHFGSVIFADATNGGTEVLVNITYFPAKTRLGRLVAMDLNPFFKQMIRNDLRSFKLQMEAEDTVENNTASKSP